MTESRVNMNRREALRLGAGSVIGAGLAGAAGLPTRANGYPGLIGRSGVANANHRGDRPRSIIFMVADGMSLGVPTLAEAFSRLVRESETRFARVMRDPTFTLGYFDMASANSLVTDSAAASSSWGSGVRINNGAINVAPDGRALTPIARIAKQAGKRVGLVTTTTITHATPAGFAANTPDRNREDDIAKQYLAEEIDVLFGGGREHFHAASRRDTADLVGQFNAQGFAIHESRESLLAGAQAADRALGLFDSGHLPYAIDRSESEELQKNVPTLAEMTRIALDSLSRGDDGFLLQVEGGRVDHAAHNNDAGAIMWEQLHIDDAIEVVLEYQKENPGTLVIITTDHGNSNPGLNGVGSHYSGSTQAFAKLAGAKASYTRLYQLLRSRGESGMTADAMRDLIAEHLGIELKADEASTMLRAVNGEIPEEPSHQHRNLVGIFGQVLGNHTGVGWTGVSHTADFVFCAARGPGQDRFAGLTRNTDAFTHLTELMGVTVRGS